MKIILLKNVKRLGKMYDVKEVKDGYAVNFLVPTKLAKIANVLNMKWLDKKKENLENILKENEKISNDLVSKISNLVLTILLKSDKEGNIFESVRVPMIIKELKKQGIEIDRSAINLNQKIKSIGEFEVPIELGNLVAKIKITTVTQEEKENS